VERLIWVRTAVSPYRQSATSHLFRGWLFNGYRRLAAQLPYWIIPVGIGESVLHVTDRSCQRKRI
jgi:hypothetical protein